MTRADAASHPDLTLTERELYERLGWFTQVRWGAGLCALVFLAVGWYAFRVRFNWRGALAAIGALFLYNLVFAAWSARLYRLKGIRREWITGLAHAQILCDLVAVAGLVHMIGGVENHFIILFIFPMIVASEFFSPGVAYGYATLAAVLVNLIGWGEYFSYERTHAALLVCTSGDPAVCEPLVAPGAAHHGIFVLQVCFVMTFAVYTTVFVASSIAVRLRRREEELEGAYRGLKSLDQVKSRFMRKTSHELRAPIGAMQSLLKAAAMQMPDGAGGRSLVDRAVQRSENMLDLIDDLLRYSRLRAAALPERFEPVELAEVVRASADLFRAQAAEKQVTLEAAADSAPVLGARDSLTDLVNNLVSNAVRYTTAGGRVRVEAGCRDGRAFLSVADTGIGIPAEDLPRVFDEFFRGEKAKQAVKHGTGLGLTIVKRVVDLHEGEIRVESDVGRGTTFHVLLPPCLGPS